MTAYKVYDVLNAIGQLIIASILWGICCLPVFTIGASCTALYYSVVKVVRRERGTVWGEFFRSFRLNFWQGTVFNLMLLGMTAAVCALAVPHLRAMQTTHTPDGILYVCFGLVLLYIWLVPYIYPVLSRFAYKTADVLRYSLYIGVRHFGKTVLMLAVLAAFAALALCSTALLIILPGVYALFCSYLLEPVFKASSTPDDDGNYDMWYGEIPKAEEEDN